jgi:hypothetical protein
MGILNPWDNGWSFKIIHTEFQFNDTDRTASVPNVPSSHRGVVEAFLRRMVVVPGCIFSRILYLTNDQETPQYKPYFVTNTIKSTTILSWSSIMPL